jgi:hypothetical protein
MSPAKTLSITLPPELLLKAEERAAREHSTVDELLGHALTKYLASDPEWEDLLQYTRAIGREMNITCEEDVERLSDEFRSKRREQRQ